MKLRTCLAILLTCGVPASFATEPVVTHFGGFTQIWFRADDYDARNGEVESVPVVMEQGLADAFEVVEGSLTGNPMAFYGDSNRHDNRDWWLEYRFDVPEAGDWFIWARAAQNSPTDNSLGSHFVWILGELSDEIPPEGTIPEFVDVFDRIFGDRFKVEGDDALVGPDAWEWVGARGSDLGHSDLADPRFPLPKPFREGPNIMRIYERESGNPSVQFEIFVVVNVDYDQYRPTDEDAITALGLVTAVHNYPVHYPSRE